MILIHITANFASNFANLCLKICSELSCRSNSCSKVCSILPHTANYFTKVRADQNKTSQKVNEKSRIVEEISFQAKYRRKATKSANFAEVRLHYFFTILYLSFRRRQRPHCQKHSVKAAAVRNYSFSLADVKVNFISYEESDLTIFFCNR